jgi:formylglycine-generating enzyme required for sulfatase activity
MVGNLAEWVADPFSRRTDPCTIAPAAPLRGGHFRSASKAGPFMFDQTLDVTMQSNFHQPDLTHVGFRCAR